MEGYLKKTMAEGRWERELSNGAEGSRILKLHQSAAKVRIVASQAAGRSPTIAALRTPLPGFLEELELRLCAPPGQLAAASISRACPRAASCAIYRLIRFYQHVQINIERRPTFIKFWFQSPA